MFDYSKKLLERAKNLKEDVKSDYLPDEEMDKKRERKFNKKIEYDTWLELKILYNERIRQENEERKELHDIRKKYMILVFECTKNYIVLVLIILFLYGVNFLKFDSSVIITFLTTTTLNVLGIAIIVAKWLFPELKIKKP